jgi:hypothetical protein
MSNHYINIAGRRRAPWPVLFGVRNPGIRESAGPRRRQGWTHRVIQHCGQKSALLDEPSECAPILARHCWSADPGLERPAKRLMSRTGPLHLDRSENGLRSIGMSVRPDAQRPGGVNNVFDLEVMAPVELFQCTRQAPK